MSEAKVADASILEPVPAAPAAMRRITSRLSAVGFNERNCGHRLGKVLDLPDFAGLKVRRPYLKSASDPLDVAISLFLLNEEVPLGEATALFTEADLYALRAMSLITVQRTGVSCPVSLLPCSGHYIVTDRSSVPSNIERPVNRVMWLYQESYILAGLVDRTTKLRSSLDLGTGSGIHALLASRHSDESFGIDINPRAIAFSTFNQHLNGCENARYILGDLYGPVAGRQFDLILSNPPYNPSATVTAGTDFWSGGSSGEEILERVIAGIDDHLTADGICHIITLLCHHASGPGYREKLDTWLVGGLGQYDVMAQVVDKESYFWNFDKDYFGSDTPEKHRAFLKKQFSRFEFGVISIRRNKNHDGFYYHGAPFVPQPLFDDDARFTGPVSHATFDMCKVKYRESVLFAAHGSGR